MSYYEQNLKVLAARQPELVEMIKGPMDTSHIQVLPSESGSPTAEVTGADGKKILIHDRHDPRARAREHVSTFDLSGNNGSVLLGFGLGYLALEMVESMDEGHLLIICESDPALFKVALTEVDLEPVLRTKRVKILLGKEIDIAAHMVKMAVKFLTSKISVIRFHPSFSLDPATYMLLEKHAGDTTRSMRINANTILHAGREMAGNVLANAPHIMRSPGVNRLFNRFSDIPAIIVGAGPSLEKNVACLKAVGNKAVIIAVDRALGLLLPLGITPHLVPSLDYSKINYDEKYAPLQMEERLFMVFSQTLYHGITRSFWGPKFSIHQTGSLSAMLSYYWGTKGVVRPGLHVGHLAFCLAQAMGCRPIILAGMDLAYTDDTLHARDIKSAVKRAPAPHLTSEGIFGDQIKTDPAFKSFVSELEREIKQAGTLCIDATEGGAKKEGTVVMRLSDALDTYCSEDHPEIGRILDEAGSQKDPARYDELARDLKHAEDAAVEIKKNCADTLKIIKKLRAMKRKGKEGTPEYCDLTVRAERMTTRIGSRGRIISMLDHYNFANILYMAKDETKRIDEIEHPFEKLDKQLDRAEVYYAALAKALGPFRKDIVRLSRRLHAEREATVRLERSAGSWRDYLSCAEMLMKCDNYTDAELHVRKALELKPDCSDACFRLGEICFAQNRFGTAIPLLNKVITLNGNHTAARALLKTCSDRNRAWEKKCSGIRARFAKIDTGEQTARERLLETGNFYYRVKDYGRAVDEYRKVVSAHPECAEGHYHLAHACLALRDIDGGVEALSSALACSPENPVIHRDLGLVSLSRGLHDAAERFFLKALELKPDDLEVKEQLGNTYYAQGMFSQAIQVYEEIVARNPRRRTAVQSLSMAYQSLIGTCQQPAEGKA